MIGYVAIVALQAVCIAHVVKTGRNQMWIAALMFVPIASALAYFVIEVLPGFSNNRHVRTTRARVSQALDPERELRAARDALELADTGGNRLRVADALAELGRHGEALAYYREGLERTAGGDEGAEARWARSLFETGAAAEALAKLDSLVAPAGQSERDRRGLLRARMLEHLGRKDEALELYEDVARRLPGEEARCRHAALLIDQGWDRKALKVLEEVEARAKRLDRLQRAEDADMYEWAAETLKVLRARGV